ncbi:unnamed protein product [Rodentolepis nana]|uniref:Uncharacterized protein n=1 Tax=Rodentolepis nana TaxID=102285 RepID=A0A0R3T6C7_RODNA|nr:unnamed protein product [Rodentolepis nana]
MLLITLSTTLLFLSLHLFLASGVPLLSAGFPMDDEKQWILAGLSLIRRLDCNHVTSISSQECMKIRISPASRFVAYLASREAGSSTHLRLSHPELGDEISSQDHENLTGVLVLDPLADRAFGHPLFIFRIVNIGGSHDEQPRKCLDKRGLLYKNECIHQDVKPDCPFIFPSATQQDNDPKSLLPGNQVCEYQFLPKVTSSEEPGRNLLQCIPHASPCVSNSHQRQRRKRLYRRRVIIPTYGNPIWNRDPQWLNPLTRRESSNSILPPRTVRHSPLLEFNQRAPSAEEDSICSSYDRCDHALILTSKFGDKESVDSHLSGHSQRRNLFDKLRSLGFASRFLSVFPPEVRPRTEYHVFDLPNKIKDPQQNVSIKSSFRSRLQKLCHTPRCVSTLFIYLNNFVLPNGDMQVGGDSLTDPNSRYSVSEFLSDLSGCQASLIFAVIDQNFGGILLEGLKSRPMEFGNLFLLSATRQANALQREQSNVERPLSEFFYPRHYAFRLGHYGLYGVANLLTHAIENLPLSQMVVGDIEKRIKSLYPHLELGSFYGNRIQTHSTALFSKPVATNPREGGFLQGRLSGQSRSSTTPRQYIAGCVSLSPIDWLRNYLPSADQVQRH